MADKEKRIQKFLAKAGFKGKLKSVKTLEEATIVIVEDSHNKYNNGIIVASSRVFTDFSFPLNPALARNFCIRFSLSAILIVYSWLDE